MIALDPDRVVAVGDHRAVPPCLNHHRLLRAIISSYCLSPRRPRPWSKDCSPWAFSAFRPWVCAFRGSIFSGPRSEEHTSELLPLMRISYAVFCLIKQTTVKTPVQYMHPAYPSKTYIMISS